MLLIKQCFQYTSEWRRPILCFWRQLDILAYYCTCKMRIWMDFSPLWYLCIFRRTSPLLMTLRNIELSSEKYQAKNFVTPDIFLFFFRNRNLKYGFGSSRISIIDDDTVTLIMHTVLCLQKTFNSQNNRKPLGLELFVSLFCHLKLWDCLPNDFRGIRKTRPAGSLLKIFNFFSN